MRLRSFFGAIVVGLATLVGCDDTPTPVPLTAPWSSMALPIGDGIVTESTPTKLRVVNPRGQEEMEPLRDSWTRALEAQGWTFGTGLTGPGDTRFTFTKEAEILQLEVVDEGDYHHSLTLTVSPAP